MGGRLAFHDWLSQADVLARGLGTGDLALLPWLALVSEVEAPKPWRAAAAARERASR